MIKIYRMVIFFSFHVCSRNYKRLKKFFNGPFSYTDKNVKIIENTLRVLKNRFKNFRTIVVFMWIENFSINSNKTKTHWMKKRLKFLLYVLSLFEDLKRGENMVQRKSKFAIYINNNIKIIVTSKAIRFKDYKIVFR